MKASDLSPFGCHALYELNRDGSGRPYENILELRADKIRNFINMSNFDSIYHFEAVHYEGLSIHGTEALIRRLESVMGVKADCQPILGEGEGSYSHYNHPPEFVDYLNKNMDWSAESLIGYKRQDPYLFTRA